MKRIQEINKIEKTAVLILGLLIALFSVVSPFQNQVFSEDCAAVQQSDADEDQEQSDSDQHIVQSIDAVPHAIHIGGLNGFTGTITEFVFSESPQVTERCSWRITGTSKYFRTLFRYIISPNAP